MRASRLTWGSGPRSALLVHGYSDDAHTWWQVGPALARCGFSVVAVDLPGHGRAARWDSYDLDVLLDHLTGLVASPQDLIVGHSLGAVLVNLAGAALPAARAVLIDPPWGELPADRGGPAQVTDPRRVAADHPRWSWTDVEVDVASSLRLDPRFTAWLAGDLLAGRELPAPPTCETLLVVPSEQPLLPRARHDELRAMGFELAVVDGAGHVVHRDQQDVLSRLLCDWTNRDRQSLCPTTGCVDLASDAVFDKEARA